METPRSLLDRLAAERDVFVDLVRAYLGFGLFAKGVYFLADRDFIAGLLVDSRGRLQLTATALAHYIPLAHISGGALLAVGLLTRLAVLVQLPILVGAVFLVHLGDGFFTRGQTLEFTLLVLVLLVLLLFHGSGRLSFDQLLRGEIDRKIAPGWRALIDWIEVRRDVTADLVRGYLGIGLVAMGVFFFAHPDFIPEALDGRWTSFPDPPLLGVLVPVVHVVGGGLLAVGLCTRAAALAQVPILVGAVLLVSWPRGFFTKEQSLEFTLLVLYLLALLVVFGSGRFSADHLRNRRPRG